MGMGKRLVVWLVVLGLLGPGLAVLGPARPAAARSIEAWVAPVPAAAAAARTSAEQPRLLVRFRPEASESARAAAIASIGGTVDRVLAQIDVTRVAIPTPNDPQSDDVGLAALRLSRAPGVLSVEPDSTGSVQFAPNDSFYLTDPSTGLGQWGIRKAHVDQAWDLVRGSASIIVAVIDTGIDANHPDLVGVTVPGTAFLSSPDPTCAPVPPGSTLDDNAHGTHVAGLIAANGNNGIGIAGVAFGVRILPIKALDCMGAGLMSDVASAVIWATDHGARIINISLGSSAGQVTLGDAIHYAVSHGVFVVAAAGNCGAGVSATCPTLNAPQYPGAYPETFAVAATDSTDQHATFSNVNSYVAIAAPGARIYSTTPTYPTTLSRSTPGTTSYALFSGTSQASPFVAGVAALLLSKDPTLTVAQLADRLRSGADDLGAPGPDPVFGAGRVNALRSLSGVAGVTTYGTTYDASGLPAKGATVAPITGTVRLTNTSNFIWSPNGPNPVRVGFHWADLAGRTVVWDGQRTVLPADVPIGGQVSVNLTIPTPAAPGTYQLRLDLVREGITWFSGAGVPPQTLTVVVTNGLAASYAPAASSQSTFALGPNAFSVTVSNTGVVTWPSAGPNPVHLSYHWLAADGSVVVWDGARALLPSDLAPGQSAVISVPVSSPDTTGSYVLRLDLVQEGVAWFSGQGVTPRDLAINVTNGFSASYVVAPLPVLLPGGRTTAQVSVRNDGLVPWPAAGANAVRIASHLADASGATVVWDGPRAVLAADLAPGQTATVALAIAAPLVPGTYVVRIDAVREGIAWLSSYGVATGNTGLTVSADYRAQLTPASTTISRAAPTVSLTIVNPTAVTWTPGGAVPLSVSSHWLAADGTVLVWDGPRLPLTQVVAPGASITLSLPLAPPPPGATSLVLDLVAEGLRWFGSGSPRSVTLVP